jgi:hypothetical protein
MNIGHSRQLLTETISQNVKRRVSIYNFTSYFFSGAAHTSKSGMLQIDYNLNTTVLL